MSQKEMPDAANISVVMVGRYELGKAVPFERTLNVLRNVIESRLPDDKHQSKNNSDPEAGSGILLSQATDQIKSWLKELGWQTIKLEE